MSLSEKLYERCKEDAEDSPDGLRTTYSQEQLLKLCKSTPSLDKLKDHKALLPVIGELVTEKLFILYKTDGVTCWGVRSRKFAIEVKKLSPQDCSVYEVIEGCHENGSWIKGIKSKTGIRDRKPLDKSLKRLEQLKLVKSIKSVKAPAQKMYIPFHLAVGEDVTGGTFYQMGELDIDLVSELSNLILFHVRQMSWYEPPKKKKIKRESSPILVRDDGDPLISAGAEAEARSGKKRKRDTIAATEQTRDIEDSAPPKKQRIEKQSSHSSSDGPPVQMPYSAGHEYPTAQSIYDFITSNNIITASKAESLNAREIQNVLNALVWDRKLEKVNEGYRTVRGVVARRTASDTNEFEDESEDKRLSQNAFADMPCGKCPAIDLCGPGKKITPAKCVYYGRWLAREPIAAA